MLDELYQELLLEHSKSPKNRGALEGPHLSLTLQNPLCGDEVTLHLAVVEDRIESAKFEGHGCSISQATASMLVERANGLSVPDFLDVLRDFKALMHGEQIDESRLGDLRALEGVKKFPVRIKCALLAVETAEKVLKQR